MSEEPVKIETPYFVSVSATGGQGHVAEVTIEPVPGAVQYNEYRTGEKLPWYRRILRRR